MAVLLHTKAFTDALYYNVSLIQTLQQLSEVTTPVAVIRTFAYEPEEQHIDEAMNVLKSGMARYTPFFNPIVRCFEFFDHTTADRFLGDLVDLSRRVCSIKFALEVSVPSVVDDVRCRDLFELSDSPLLIPI